MAVGGVSSGMDIYKNKCSFGVIVQEEGIAQRIGGRKGDLLNSLIGF